MPSRLPFPKPRQRFADAEEAASAVEGLEVDWTAEAAESAASYLKHTSMSRSELIDQLVFEGFTTSQAEAGVSAAGL